MRVHEELRTNRSEADVSYGVLVRNFPNVKKRERMQFQFCCKRTKEYLCQPFRKRVMGNRSCFQLKFRGTADSQRRPPIVPGLPDEQHKEHQNLSRGRFTRCLRLYGESCLSALAHRKRGAPTIGDCLFALGNRVSPASSGKWRDSAPHMRLKTALESNLQERRPGAEERGVGLLALHISSPFHLPKTVGGSKRLG